MLRTIRTQLLTWFSILVYTLTFCLTSFTLWVPPAHADCFFIIFCSSSKSSFRSKGGVKRGPCAEELDLLALAPERKLESTVESYPTFWFYVPPYKPSIGLAKFVLLDENNHLVRDPIYAQLPQTLPESQSAKALGTIAGLTLPAGKGLEVGKRYSWHFSILCDRQKPSRNPEVTGRIQRVLKGPLPRVPEPDYIVHNNTYTGLNDIESVVFYDTITQLVKRRSTYSFDWNTLLNNLELPSSVKTGTFYPLESPPEICDSPNDAT
jgi:hypothetical protein